MLLGKKEDNGICKEGTPTSWLQTTVATNGSGLDHVNKPQETIRTTLLLLFFFFWRFYFPLL